jgi:hypothetical protein
VDHAGSRLLIPRNDGEVVRTLRPRLNAAPDVLHAETGGLTPGRYVLRWEARPRPSGPVETGTLDFTVR